MKKEKPAKRLRWAIFCHVIDNWGDLGVCWRLATNLAMLGQQVRLFVDDDRPLAWMAPNGAQDIELVNWPGDQMLPAACLAPERMDDVVIEAFGCTLPQAYLAVFAANGGRQALLAANWLNVEYLSAEPYAKRCHALPSPVSAGPGAGLAKYFFYPGFVPGTGGLLREPDLIKRRKAFRRSRWLHARGVHWDGKTLVSLFCYETPRLLDLLSSLAAGEKAVVLLVCAGRGAQAVKRALKLPDAAEQAQPSPQLEIIFLPPLSQNDFDRLLWSCDLNFVRGEDSLTRALWAGKPFVWQIYPQTDDAHKVKLHAFLDWMQAPDSLRAMQAQWNEVDTTAWAGSAWLGDQVLRTWKANSVQARKRLLGQPDLASQLLQFVWGDATRAEKPIREKPNRH